MDDRVDAMPTTVRWRFFKHLPCMDDELLDATTTPPVTIRNLSQPRLRKCPFDINTIDWARAVKLGVGYDGCVYRVYFGDQGPFALKLFWTSDIKSAYPGYSSLQRECQNAALLQMLRAVIDQVAAAAAAVAKGVTPEGPTSPPFVRPNPQDFIDASENLLAFSVQRRRAYKDRQQPPPGMVPLTSMPRFAQCYGWLPCNVHELMAKMPRHKRQYVHHVDWKTRRSFDETRTDFIAIVYEYIRSDSSNDDDGGNGGNGGDGGGDAVAVGGDGSKSEKGQGQTAAEHDQTADDGTGAVPRYNTRSRARARQAAHEPPTGDKEEARDKEARDKEARDKEARDKEARDKEARDKEARDKEARDKEARDEAARDKKARSKKARSKKARSKEARDKKARDKKARDEAARDEAARDEAARDEEEARKREEANRAPLTAKEARHRARVAAVSDFLWLAGFDFATQPLARNWKNGVLVDHGDIVSPYSCGWHRRPGDTQWRLDRILTPN